MENNPMPKLIFEKTVNGTVYLVNATTPAGNQGQFALSMVKEGNPFWWFPSVPAGKVIGCDFTNAPICAGTAAANNTLIAGITTQPEDVLTYE